MKDATNKPILKKHIISDFKKEDTCEFLKFFGDFKKIFPIIRPPFTVGLYGPWGSGKTTMIEALKNELNPDYPTLIFDAWEYRNEENLILPILVKLKKLYSKDKTSAKKVLKTTALMALSQIVKNKTGIDLEKIMDITEQYEKDYENYILEIDSLKEDFSKFVEEIANQHNNNSPIIFIDNLDRCMPDIILNLLEDISSYFSLGKCVFVLAMDQNIVINAIKHKFGNLNNFDGKSYLEKIINIALKMPSLSNTQKKAYHFMKRYELAYGIDTNINPELKSSKEDTMDNLYNSIKNTIEDLINSGVLDNPRRIEHIINQLVLIQIIKRDNFNNENAILFLLMITLKEYFYEHVYKYIKVSTDVEKVLRLSGLVSPERATLIDLGRTDDDRKKLIEKYGVFWKVFESNYEFRKLFSLFRSEKEKLISKGLNTDKITDKVFEIKQSLDILG